MTASSQFLYLVNELSGTVSSFNVTYSLDSGISFSKFATYDTLTGASGNRTATNFPAEVAVHVWISSGNIHVAPAIPTDSFIGNFTRHL